MTTQTTASTANHIDWAQSPIYHGNNEWSYALMRGGWMRWGEGPDYLARNWPIACHGCRRVHGGPWEAKMTMVSHCRVFYCAHCGDLAPPLLDGRKAARRQPASLEPDPSTRRIRRR